MLTDIVFDNSTGGLDTIDVAGVVVNVFVMVFIVVVAVGDTAVIGPVKVFGSPVGTKPLASSPPPLSLPMMFESQEFAEVVRTMILRFIARRGNLTSRLGEIGFSPHFASGR